jgi:hypothetical protein
MARVKVMVLNATFNNISVILPVQSVPFTTKVVSSNHVLGEVYSIHYVIKCVTRVKLADNTR